MVEYGKILFYKEEYIQHQNKNKSNNNVNINILVIYKCNNYEEKNLFYVVV